MASNYFENTKEIEVDEVAAAGEVIAMPVSEPVGNAGVHSADATSVVPPQRTYWETIRKIERITTEIARCTFCNATGRLLQFRFP